MAGPSKFDTRYGGGAVAPAGPPAGKAAAALGNVRSGFPAAPTTGKHPAAAGLSVGIITKGPSGPKTPPATRPPAAGKAPSAKGLSKGSTR